MIWTSSPKWASPGQIIQILIYRRLHYFAEPSKEMVLF